MSGVYKGAFQPSDGALPDDHDPKEPYSPVVHRTPPPEGFDALNASDVDLEKYNLPPRPDGTAAPRALFSWKRAMSLPFCFVPVKSSDVSGPADSGQQAGNAGAEARVQESSRNWSGAYIRSNDAGQFVLVEAMWLVPKPYPPAPRRAEATKPMTEFRSSVWIGLDGHDATSMSLPQIGTSQIVTVDDKDPAKAPVCRTFAWWQWWVRRGSNNMPRLIGGFPVSSGSLMYCRLTVRTPERVNLFIKNQSSGAVIAFDVEAPKPDNPAQIRQTIVTEGRTAEWVLERPTKIGKNELYTLPDYGAALFYACNAAVMTENGWEERQLQEARLIAMKDWDGEHPGAVTSTPMRQNENSVLLCYEGNLP
jgi:hypothetical protein